MIIKKETSLLEDCEAPVISVTQFSMEGAVSFSSSLRKFNSCSNINDIFINICSYGGEVWPMLAMLDEVLQSPKNVHGICTGLCASAGAMLFCCMPGTRYIANSSQLMLHRVSDGMRGTVPELEREVKTTKFLDKSIFDLLGKRLSKCKSSSALNLKQVMEFIKENGDWYLSANKAVKFGLADKVGVPYFTKTTIIEGLCRD
jgi:ATP-dependent protease ClpP protease subunit